MPSERLVAALNDQIAREFAAAHQYVAVGAWYEAETFPRLGRFFYGQAEEERGHALKMVTFLLEAGARPRLDDVPAPQGEFEDHVAPIQLALDQERSVTVEIGKLFDLARETRDHAAEIFLQWFVQEQVEEESTMQSLLQVAQRVREFPMMLEEFVAHEGDSLGSSSGG